MIDRDGVPQWQGEPHLAEEWEERVWLRFFATPADARALLPPRIKNGLSGRAWENTHRLPEIAVRELMRIATEKDGSAERAMQTLVTTVKSALTQNASLRKNEVFRQFFRKGYRRPGEEVNDYIARRETEYSRMRELSGDTSVSPDLRAFFLLDMASIDETQHLKILGQAGNEYDLARIKAVMAIQMAHVHHKEARQRSSHPRAPPIGRGKGHGGRRAYPIEEEEQDAYAFQDAEDDTWSPTTEDDDHDQGGFYPPPPAPYHDDEAELVLYGDYARDVEEFEHCFAGEVMTYSTPDEQQVFAQEAQKLGRAAPYHEARRKLATQRTDRNHGLKARFTGTGTITFNDKDAQRRLDEIKRTTRCDDCGEVGHWAGDAACQRPRKRIRPDSTPSAAPAAARTPAPAKGAGRPRGGRGVHGRGTGRGGFMARAGLALFTMMFGCSVPESDAIEHACYAIAALGAYPIRTCSPTAVIVDTAAVVAVAGEKALEAFVESSSATVTFTESRHTFKGIDSDSPVVSTTTAAVPLAIGNRICVVRFAVIPKDIPMIMGVQVLEALGANLNVRGLDIQFSELQVKQPLIKLGSGHLALECAPTGSTPPLTVPQQSTPAVDIYPVSETPRKGHGFTTTRHGHGTLKREQRHRLEALEQELEKEETVLWQRLRPPARRSIVATEIFTARAMITEVVLNQFGPDTAGRPRDILFGDDLTQPEHQRRCLETLDRDDPYLTIVAFPCTVWSAINRIGNTRSPGEMKKARTLLRFVAEIVENCLRRRAHVLLENPLTSMAWSRRELKAVLDDLRLLSVRADQCATGLRSLRDGLLVMKPTRFVTTAAALANILATARCTKDHEHGSVMGHGHSAATGEYTEGLAQLVARGIAQQQRLEEHFGDVMLGLPAADDAFPVGEEPEPKRPRTSEQAVPDLDFDEDLVDDLDGGNLPAPPPEAVEPPADAMSQHGPARPEADEQPPPPADPVRPRPLPEDPQAEPPRAHAEPQDEPMPQPDDQAPPPPPVPPAAAARKPGPPPLPGEAPELPRAPQPDDRHPPPPPVPPAVQAAVRRLHANLGHPRPEVLARMLRLGGARDEAIRFAKAYKCPICLRHARTLPRAPARPPRTTEFNELVAMDAFTLTDLEGTQFAVLVIVDLASTYTVCRVMRDTNINNPTSKAASKAFDDGWLHWAGPPQQILVDQGSSFRGATIELCNDLGIPIQLTATEAHWQNSLAERRIGHIKHMADRVFEEKEVTGVDAVSVALSAITFAANSLANREGFTPTQWVLGQNIRIPGSLMDERTSVTEHEAALSRKSNMWGKLDLQETAARAFHKAANDEKLRRALVAGIRPVPADFAPGQLVHYYRSRNNIGARPAECWHGPARIIGQDGSNWWLVHNGMPILAAARLMRPSTPDEVDSWMEVQSDAALGRAPRFGRRYGQQGADAPRGFLDLRADVFPPPEQDGPPLPPPAGPPGQAASSSSGSAAAAAGAPAAHHDRLGSVPGSPSTPPANARTTPTSRQRPPPASRTSPLHHGTAHAPTVPSPSVRATGSSRAGDGSPVDDVATHHPVPPAPAPAPPRAADAPRRRMRQKGPGPKRARGGDTTDHAMPCTADPSFWQSFVAERVHHDDDDHDAKDDVTKKGAKGREIRMQDCTPAQQRQYRDALGDEWRKWVKYGAARLVPPAEAKTVDRKDIITSRVVNTDKNERARTLDPSLPLLPKARMCARGFQETTLGQFRRDAPTASQIAQHLILWLSVSNDWTLESGDIESAYFQGYDMKRKAYIIPPKGGIPGVPEGSLLQALKPIYGFTDAGRNLWLRLLDELKDIGFVPSVFEPALFFLTDENGRTIAAVCTHVDDVLCTFSDHPRAQEAKRKLRAAFTWGKWDQDDFVYTGRHFSKTDRRIDVDMCEFVRSIAPVRVGRERKQQRDSPLTPHETAQFLSLVGQISWATRMLLIQFAARNAVLQRSMKGPTVEHLVEANSIIRAIRVQQHHKLSFHPVDPEQLAVVAATDAAFDNLAGHSSQGGYLIGVMPQAALDDREHLHGFTPLMWKSGKIRRVVRSTLAAEAYQAGEATEALEYLRNLLAETRDITFTRNVETRYTKPLAIPGVLVTDARSLYDCLHAAKLNVADRRVSLEAALIREAMQGNITVCWVRSEQMIADCLTKAGADPRYLLEVLDSGLWSLGPDVRAGFLRGGRTLAPPDPPAA